MITPERRRELREIAEYSVAECVPIPHSLMPSDRDEAELLVFFTQLYAYMLPRNGYEKAYRELRAWLLEWKRNLSGVNGSDGAAFVLDTVIVQMDRLSPEGGREDRCTESSI